MRLLTKAVSTPVVARTDERPAMLPNGDAWGAPRRAALAVVAREAPALFGVSLGALGVVWPEAASARAGVLIDHWVDSPDDCSDISEESSLVGGDGWSRTAPALLSPLGLRRLSTQ